jgi:hypothetical protein
MYLPEQDKILRQKQHASCKRIPEFIPDKEAAPNILQYFDILRKNRKVSIWFQEMMNIHFL